MPGKSKKRAAKYSHKPSSETLVEEASAEKYITAKSVSAATVNVIYGGGKLTGVAGSAKDITGNTGNKYRTGAVAILVDATDKPEKDMTALEKMKIVRIGIRKKDLENLKEKAKLDYDKLAKALAVTRATLINKKSEEKFNAVLSERIVGLAELYSYGFEVFEDEDRFNRWIFRPNKALGGLVPYELIDNQFGREEVRSIIGRIDYGVYS